MGPVVVNQSVDHAAIWSLCVSNGDLVTHVLDIENVGDQIDASGVAPDRALTSSGHRALND